MKGIEGFILGMLSGIAFTVVTILLISKSMTKKEKEETIKKGREKWKNKK